MAGNYSSIPSIPTLHGGHNLAALCERYRARFTTRHGGHTTESQWSALNALLGCHTQQYGTLDLACQHCAGTQCRYRSCGHRFCNQCQQHSTRSWLDRQSRKLLPVDYYLVTFTLPFQLRALAKAHSTVVLPLLMQCAADTLKRFGRNEPGLHAQLGLCAVLHTHTRRLDYHPHVHVVVPGGGVNVKRNEWRTLKGQYLFNGRALAKAFRGTFLRALSDAGLSIPNTPERWVAQCECVGRGVPAVQYLSRYLYRGVIADRNLIHDDGERITFRYQDGKTKRWETRTLPGEDFMALLLQHVLPKGLRRARDYGFLHGNAKRILKIVQWVLRVHLPERLAPSKAQFRCPHCQGRMHVIRMSPPRPKLESG
jgi:Putative transposase/Transposase zinc-binding domain